MENLERLEKKKKRQIVLWNYRAEENEGVVEVNERGSFSFSSSSS